MNRRVAGRAEAAPAVARAEQRVLDILLHESEQVLLRRTAELDRLT